MNQARRWLFDAAARRAWWLDVERARVLAWRGEVMQVLAELPDPASVLARLDDRHLLALGLHGAWRVCVDDGRLDTVALDERCRPSVDAELIGLGPSCFAWIEPGGLSLRMFESGTQIGCVLWPSEPRVAHHGPRVAVDARQRRLAWCHVVGAIDVVDVERGGRARLLGDRPPASTRTGAAVLPPCFAHGLWFDHDGARVAAGFGDAQGVQLVIHDCDADGESELLLLTDEPARVLSLDLDARAAVVACEQAVERVGFDARRTTLQHPLASVVAATIDDRCIGLADDDGRCCWIEEPGA